MRGEASCGRGQASRDRGEASRDRREALRNRRELPARNPSGKRSEEQDQLGYTRLVERSCMQTIEQVKSSHDAARKHHVR